MRPSLRWPIRHGEPSLRAWHLGSIRNGTRPAVCDEPASDLEHLRVLEKAGLIARPRSAAPTAQIEAEPLKEAGGWLERYRAIWEGNFRRLDALLEELQPRRQMQTAKKENAGERKRASQETR